MKKNDFDLFKGEKKKFIMSMHGQLEYRKIKYESRL